MLALLTYKTHPRFSDAFKEFYTNANLNQIRVLSTAIFIIAFLSRITSVFYYEKVIQIANYAEHSLCNWIQIGGSILFYALSRIALRSGKWTLIQRKFLVRTFVIFILLITLGVSYAVSLHNTKNTLTMFLIGIVAASLFFSIEYEEIIIIAIIIVFVFLLGMVFPKITFQEKMMNMLAAVTLGTILVTFSRYSYFFKSKHFVRLKLLEEKNLEIERLNIQKSDILAFVAHDLRNPLNNIEALSSLLMADSRYTDEASMIKNSASHATEIINDLLEAVKSDESQLKLENVNLVPFLVRVINRWKNNSKRTITMSCRDMAIIAKVNPSKLERVIDNLVSNALKFSPRKKLVEIELFTHDQNACILVVDHGIGIPENLQSNVFNQFSTAGRKGLHGEKSIGLGLHISKRIVEQHNGTLLMKSLEQKGTTFTILLPLSTVG